MHLGPEQRAVLAQRLVFERARNRFASNTLLMAIGTGLAPWRRAERREVLADHFITLIAVHRQEPIVDVQRMARSEEHTSELQSLMRISYAVFCLKKKKDRKKSRDHIQSSRRQK